MGAKTKKSETKHKHDAIVKEFIYANFIGHDIMFLSDMLCNMKIDVECPCCTAQMNQLMAMRSALIKELNKMAAR